MPELPEVETLLRQLKRPLTDAKVSRVFIHDDRILNVSKALCAERLKNQIFKRLFRRGKYLCFETDSGRQLWFHLGMTGRLFLAAESSLPHTHLEIHFEGCRERLFFSDPRRFGRVVYHEAGRTHLPEGIRLTAPDPFEISLEAFVQTFYGRAGVIKSLLLNQRLVSGVGNIYADESLFRAGIRPRKRASRLSRARLEALYSSVVAVLEEAIRGGGSSIDDYRHLDGQKGSFQDRHRVYGRAGQPCPVCGQTVKVTVISGRSSHYCLVCQK